MRPIYRASSFYIIMLISLLMLAQAVPFFGLLFMFAGAPFLTGFLVHILMLAILLDTYRRVFPSICFAIPLLFYGLYYTSYVAQIINIERHEADLKQQNGVVKVHFDPTTQDLMMSDAARFISLHRIDIVYERSTTPGELFAYRFLAPNQCKGKNVDWRTHVKIDHISPRLGGVSSCLEKTRSKPTKNIVEVITTSPFSTWIERNIQWQKDHQDPKKYHPDYERFRANEAKNYESTSPWDKLSAGGLPHYYFSHGQIKVLNDNTTIAVFKTAGAWRLNPYPIITLGCALLKGLACVNGFYQTPFVLDTMPNGLESKKADDRISAILNIENRTPEDFQKIDIDMRWLSQVPVVLQR